MPDKDCKETLCNERIKLRVLQRCATLQSLQLLEKWIASFEPEPDRSCSTLDYMLMQG